MNPKKIVVLFGQGGLSDVGRHAIWTAIREHECAEVTVLTQHPELLWEENWNCGCPEPHIFTKEEKETKINMVQVDGDSWTTEDYAVHFAGAQAVVSCVGNRQATFMGVPASSWCAHEANEKVVIPAMAANKIRRVVVLTSTGVEEDWPALEFHWAGKVLSCMFLTCVRKAFRDLTNTEKAYRATAAEAVDFLIVRPVGIGEDTLPKNQWKIQTKKHEDTDIDFEMAKLDVARYMVQEALKPTRHRGAVVIGGVKEPGK